MREENAEIVEMLRSMKKDMEEREHKWERQQQIREKIWKLKLEEKNRCGSITGKKEKNNGKKS